MNNNAKSTTIITNKKSGKYHLYDFVHTFENLSNEIETQKKQDKASTNIDIYENSLYYSHSVNSILGRILQLEGLGV